MTSETRDSGEAASPLPGEPGDEVEAELAAGDAGALEALLDFMRDRRGFDFSGYKRPSLVRRITRRMQQVGVASFADYLGLLESQPAEFTALFDTILINVTAFMRDPDAWEFVKENVIPQMIVQAERREGDIRVWSAGCASGEEPYTLAVLLAEAVGEDRFRAGVKIYATDADESALAEARHARYRRADLVKALGEERVDRYFEDGDGRCTFRTDLRRSIIFGRHDLVQDPPISRLDMVVCRNTLMYFNADVQRRILSSFHFSLNDGGYLFLGKAEALVTRTNLFAPIDVKRHVFVKHGHAAAPRLSSPGAGGAASNSGRGPATVTLVDAAFEGGPTAQLAIDVDGVLVAANRQARSLFGLGAKQVGVLLRDLEVSYRPVELRSLIDQVVSLRRPVTVPEVEHRGPNNSVEYLDVVVQPVDRAGGLLGCVVTFVDVTRFKVLHNEIEQSQRELEIAHEELQSAVEELETTNEELQSTNEELETTNEELHSSNEELETMNEELHSSNEELAAVNNELRATSQELRSTNQFFQAVLQGLNVGVAVLTRDLAVTAWNRHAEDLWGLRGDEVMGTNFLNLDIGLPTEHLRVPIRSAITGDGSPVRLRLDAINRRGRNISVDVIVTRLETEDADRGGVILVMEEVAEDGRHPPG